MKEQDDRLFAFKTLDEAIEVTNNHIVNCLCWWTDERFHNSQTKHVWHTWLQCAEDFSQLNRWLKKLQYLEDKYDKVREILLTYEDDKEMCDILFKEIIGVEREECVQN